MHFCSISSIAASFICPIPHNDKHIWLKTLLHTWNKSVKDIKEAQLKHGLVKAAWLRRSTWRTCVTRVLQVEKRRSLLLPHLLVFLQLLLELPQMVVGKAISRKETFLKPQLAQEDVQRDGSHHEAEIERESGSQDLHAGPGVSLSINLTGAELETVITEGFSAKAPTSSPKLAAVLPCWRVRLMKVWFAP